MMMPSTPGQTSLDKKTFQRALSELAARDARLAEILARWGEPPLWTHPAGFPGLVLAILSQQVSLESARAAYGRLEESIQSITPERFLSLNDTELLGVGFSRQKASYVRGIAQEIIRRELDLETLEAMDDDPARRRLLALRGVGPWTADVYLLFALRRPDAWPSGDLALEIAVQDMLGLSVKPSTEEVDTLAQGWKPWRAVVARILWHAYLSQRGRS
jgi:DNA-3-methyladenine glycosylase II